MTLYALPYLKELSLNMNNMVKFLNPRADCFYPFKLYDYSLMLMYIF